MLNQTIIVGRLTKDPEIYQTDNGKKKTQIVVAVSRSFKNLEGTYDTDFIKCVLWNGIAESTCEYCKKGDVVGIKGRLQTHSFEREGERVYNTEVIAEKVTFLTNGKNKEKEEE